MAGRDAHVVLVGGDGHPSGVPTHITALAHALVPLARVTVVSEADAGGYSEVAAAGARHVALPGLASRLDPGQARRGKRALLALLQSEPADVVWFHARLPVIMGRQLLASGAWQPPAGSRIALTYHGLPFGPGHRRGTSLVSKELERRLLTQSPPLELVFLNESQRHDMQQAMGARLARHRTHVLGNTSSLGALPAPAGVGEAPLQGRHLVMTGRCGYQKNYSAALTLMRHLPEDISLSLCGHGTGSPSFLRRVRKLAGPAAARVRCLGPLSDIRPLLARADGYMLLSRYEGVPIGALEACESGLPLILADFNGARDLLADQPIGLLLTEARPADRARAIDALLTDYLANRADLTARIKAHWARRWSTAAFERQAQALLRGWLDR